MIFPYKCIQEYGIHSKSINFAVQPMQVKPAGDRCATKYDVSWYIIFER